MSVSESMLTNYRKHSHLSPICSRAAEIPETDYHGGLHQMRGKVARITFPYTAHVPDRFSIPFPVLSLPVMATDLEARLTQHLDVMSRMSGSLDRLVEHQIHTDQPHQHPTTPPAPCQLHLPVPSPIHPPPVRPAAHPRTPTQYTPEQSSSQDTTQHPTNYTPQYPAQYPRRPPPKTPQRNPPTVSNCSYDILSREINF